METFTAKKLFLSTELKYEGGFGTLESLFATRWATSRSIMSGKP
jgi:hypothetical protein